MTVVELARESIGAHSNPGLAPKQAASSPPLIPAQPRPLILLVAARRSKDERALTSEALPFVVRPSRLARHLPALVAAALLATVLCAGVAFADSSVNIVDAPRPEPKWGYGPATVRVAPGTWVTWSNAGGETHTVTADDGSFDSGALDPGEGYSWYFDETGRFSYSCTLHPWMKGMVVVGGDAAPAPTPDQITVAEPVGGMVPASSGEPGPYDQAVPSGPSDSTDPSAVLEDPAT